MQQQRYPGGRCAKFILLLGLLLGGCLNGMALAQSLTVSAGVSPTVAVSNQTVTASISYNANDLSTGLGVRLHWDSSNLSFAGVSNVFSQDLLQVGSPQVDGGDFDGDPSTDSFVNISWVSLAEDWPGTLAIPLFNVGFTTQEGFSGSPLNLSLSGTPLGFSSSTLGTQVTSNEIDLAIQKSAPPAINPGSALDFAILVENLGPSDGNNIPVTDSFPQGVFGCTWVCSASPSANCPASGEGDINTLVDIPAGGYVDFAAVCDVDPEASALVVNTASVGVPAGLVDSNLSNNAASSSVVIITPTLQLLPGMTVLPDAPLGVSYRFDFDILGGNPPYSVASVDLPEGLSLSVVANQVILQGTPMESGDFSIPVRVSDVGSASVSRSYSLSITGDALALTPDTLPTGERLRDYSATLTAVGGVGPLSLSAEGEVPGLSISIDGATLSLAGIPSAEGEYPLTVTVTDTGSDLEPLVTSYTVSIEPLSVLSISPLASLLPEALVDNDYEVVFSVSGGLPPYTLSIQAAVPGLSETLGESSLELAGIPTEVGDYAITVTVSDSLEDSEPLSREYTLPVVTDLSPLALSPTTTTLIASIAEPFTEAFQAIGGVPPYNLNLSGVVPGLMASANGDGTLSLDGTPTELGVFAVTVSAADSADPPSSLSVEYQVRVTGDIRLLPTALPAADLGRDYLVSFNLQNGISPQQFTLVGDPPPGLELVNNNLLGVPSQPGVYTVAIEAVDAQGNTGAASYQLIVNDGLVIGESLPDAVRNASYSEQFTLFGGEAPVDWRLNSALPDGLTLQNTGFLVGVPEVAGDFSLNVTATDNQGAQVTDDVSLQILPTGIVDLSGEAPSGLVGEYYEFPIVLSGGNPPYNCTLLDGMLPPGLELDGCASTIAGIPSESGSFNFTVLATDSSQPALELTLPQIINVAADTPIPRGEPPMVNPAASVRVPIYDISRDTPPAEGYQDEFLQQATVDAYGNRLLVGYAWRGDNYDTYIVGLDRHNQLFRQQRIDLGAQDFGYGVSVSPVDQSLYVSGFSFVAAEFEAFLVKLDAAGVLEWQRTNTAGPQGTVFYDVVADTTGVVVVGERYNADGNFDASITRYDHDGNLVWDRVRATGDTESAFRVAFEPCDTPARDTACGLIVVGTTGQALSRGWILRLDPATGGVLDEAELADTGGLGLVLADNGDLIIGGMNAANLWQVERLTPDLQRRWVVSYPAAGLLRSVALDREGNIYAAGRLRENGDDDGLLVIFSPEGAELDTYRYSEGGSERFSEVVIGPTGRVSVAGGQRDDSGGRFLLLDVETGKDF